MKDANTFEGARIVSYVYELEQRVAAAEANSNAVKVDQMQKSIIALEDELSKKNRKIKDLHLKVAQLGMQLGKLLDNKNPSEAYVEIHGYDPDTFSDPIFTTKP